MADKPLDAIEALAIGRSGDASVRLKENGASNDLALAVMKVMTLTASGRNDDYSNRLAIGSLRDELRRDRSENRQRFRDVTKAVKASQSDTARQGKELGGRIGNLENDNARLNEQLKTANRDIWLMLGLASFFLTVLTAILTFTNS